MSECTIAMPEYLATWRPTLYPGSPEATARGCTCPEQYVQSLQWPRVLTYDTDCPIHTESVRNAYLKILYAEP